MGLAEGRDEVGMGVASPDKSWRGRGRPAGAGGSHVGARAHMTGRAMDPLPSPAVAAAAEAEADEEADPPATGRARGPVKSREPRSRGPPVGATPRLTRGGGDILELASSRCFQGRCPVSARSCGVAPGSFLSPPCKRSPREWLMLL